VQTNATVQIFDVGKTFKKFPTDIPVIPAHSLYLSCITVGKRARKLNFAHANVSQ
jgi:hypothetical protein